MDNQAFKRKQMMKSSIAACSRRSKRKRGDLPYLPREIIFDILSRLPAEFLHDECKYVCKTWANIIRDPTFAQTHLLHSNEVFLIHDTVKRCNIRYLEAKEGKIKVTSHKKNHLPEERLLASSEGILLSIFRGMLYVANCVTKQGLKLPCFRSTTCKTPFLHKSSIACIPHTRDFKVIVPCGGLDGYGHCHVLTVGTGMSWRKIETELKEGLFSVFAMKPFSINGVIYWAHHSPTPPLLVCDLRDETIHYVKLPEEFMMNDEKGASLAYGFQKMDNYLSCTVRGANQMEAYVWILKNIYNSEWAKIRKIESKLPLWDSWNTYPLLG